MTSSSSPPAGSRWRGPRWLRLVVGVLLVVLGASVVLKPFASLTVLVLLLVTTSVVAGFGELLRRDPDDGPWRWVRGGAYLLAAVLVLVWPSATIRVVAATVGVALVVGGVADLVTARRVRGTARSHAVLGGGTSVLLGLLALTWPDVTVLVVAVVFGASVVVVGVRQVVAFAKGDDVPLVRRPSRAAAPRGGWWRLTGTALGALAAVALVAVGLVLQRDAPEPDAFYDPPAVALDEPGRLLRSEPYDDPGVPAGARAWRILYVTTRDEGEPAVASGLVIAPTSATGESAEPSDVVAWAHGTTGFARGCAPSILPNGLAAGAMHVQDEVVQRGWTLVATDYVGLGTPGPHPYLVGQGEGRSVLDAVRAAHQLEDVSLSDDTVVWGHSQGGHAALWTGMLAPTYAPDLTIDGVAALAPASDLPGLIATFGDVTGGELFASFALAAYTATYPDVVASDVVRPGARILTEEMAGRCLAEKSVLVSVLTALSLDSTIWSGDPDRGAFGARLRENVPAGPIPAPLLVAQGADDSLITPAVQAAYVQDRCDAGQQVDYRTYPGRGHVPLVEPDSPAVADLLVWTRDRFEGRPAVDTC